MTMGLHGWLFTGVQRSLLLHHLLFLPHLSLSLRRFLFLCLPTSLCTAWPCASMPEAAHVTTVGPSCRILVISRRSSSSSSIQLVLIHWCARVHTHGATIIGHRGSTASSGGGGSCSAGGSVSVSASAPHVDGSAIVSTNHVRVIEHTRDARASAAVSVGVTVSDSVSISVSVSVSDSVSISVSVSVSVGHVSELCKATRKGSSCLFHGLHHTCCKQKVKELSAIAAVHLKLGEAEKGREAHVQGKR